MSEEPSKPLSLDEYFQFTPLASVAPVRSVIDSFLKPEVRSCLLPQAQARQAIEPLESAQAFEEILRVANETRDRIPFRPTFSRRVLDARTTPQKLSPSIRRLLENYAGFPVDEKTFTPLAKPHYTIIDERHPVAQTPSSNRSIHEQCSVQQNAPDTVKKMVYSVEVKSSSSHRDPTTETNSPSKRARENDVGLQTPTKKARKSKSDSPSKPLSIQKQSDLALLANLKSERAAAVEAVQSFIEDIFEAEDELESDTSTNDVTAGSSFFNMETSDRVLGFDALHKLLSLFRKLVRMNVLATLDREMLSRIQKIILRSVTVMHLQKFETLEVELSDEAERAWLDLVHGALVSLTSSLCIACMLEMFVDNQDLYSEETLLMIIDSLKSVLEDLFFRWFSINTKPQLALFEKHNKFLGTVLQSAVSLLQHLSIMLSMLDITESIVSRVVFLTINTIFADSGGKNGVVCSQLIIESLKTASVATLQTIFIKFPYQRQFMLDEVLSSLSKLPANRQMARQFKLASGKNIQLASSLLLHLVQSCAVNVAIASDPLQLVKEESKLEDAAAAMLDVDESQNGFVIPAHLEQFSTRLGAADEVGKYMINFLLEKSVKSSKSASAGEEAPFKALVDVFIEDFVTVLHYPEWPAAELMLRWIANSMLKLADNPKQNAQVRVSAVDALCSIACKVRATTLVIRGTPKELEGSSLVLPELPSFDLLAGTNERQVRGLEELQRLLCQHLSACARNDGTYRASLEYSLASWIRVLLQSCTRKSQDSTLRSLLLDSANQLAALQKHLDSSNLTDTRRLPMGESSVSAVYLKILSFSGLLRMFEVILPRLLMTMDNSQVALRTKTLRSFGRLAEVDPLILSMRPVQTQIGMRVSDTSPQVRDVALDLLGRYIAANPQSGSQYYPVLRERIMDTGLSVRKRVIKLCKELYVNNTDQALRIDIATQFVYRTHDEEDSVQDLVFKSLEAMWFAPIRPFAVTDEVNLSSLSVREGRELQSRALIIGVLAADQRENLVELLTEFLKDLSEKVTTNAVEVLRVFQLLVQSFTGDIVQEEDELSRLRSLIALKVLALSVPRSFSSNQMESLLPYLQYGSSKFEQNSPIHVACIYTAILPKLITVGLQFLTDVQSTLLSQLTRLPVKTLNEVVPCLCAIVHLRTDFVRVSKTLKSCLQRIQLLQGQKLKTATQQDKQIILLLHLIGLFGRYLSLQSIPLLEDVFDVRTPEELIKVSISSIFPFCQVDQNESISPIGKAALQSLGNVCINNPKFFQDTSVIGYTDAIMNGPQVEAKKTLIVIYSEYLVVEQKKNDLQTKGPDTILVGKTKDSKRKPKSGDVAHVDVTILTGNTDKFATDGISPSLMQRYLGYFLEAALGLDVPLAIAATNIICHIVSQGLANPRNCVPTIIALETSNEPKLRDSAALIHRTLFEKHESLIETCYIDGVKAAFDYRVRTGTETQFSQDIATISTLYNIVRSSRKGRHKFLTAFVRGLDTDLDKINTLTERDVKYSLFIAHNAACLDYSTNEEVHVIISAIDKMLSTTGACFLQLLDNPETIAENQEQFGMVAAIICYSIKLREQLKLVYGIHESKCRSFQPTKLGTKAETRAATRKADVPLCPDWSDLHEPASPKQRIESFNTQFNKNDHILPEDESSSGEQDETERNTGPERTTVDPMSLEYIQV